MRMQLMLAHAGLLFLTDCFTKCMHVVFGILTLCMHAVDLSYWQTRYLNCWCMQNLLLLWYSAYVRYMLPLVGLTLKGAAHGSGLIFELDVAG